MNMTALQLMTWLTCSANIEEKTLYGKIRLSSLCLTWFILLRNFANTQLDIGETITGICLGIGTYVNTPMWFITCLFCVNVLMYFITKCIRNFKIRNLFILCVSVICYLYSRFIGIKLPCSLDSAGIALVFSGGGT